MSARLVMISPMARMLLLLVSWSVEQKFWNSLVWDLRVCMKLVTVERTGVDSARVVLASGWTWSFSDSSAMTRERLSM